MNLFAVIRWRRCYESAKRVEVAESAPSVVVRMEEIFRAETSEVFPVVLLQGAAAQEEVFISKVQMD